MCPRIPSLSTAARELVHLSERARVLRQTWCNQVNKWVLQNSTSSCWVLYQTFLHSSSHLLLQRSQNWLTSADSVLWILAFYKVSNKIDLDKHKELRSREQNCGEGRDLGNHVFFIFHTTYCDVLWQISIVQPLNKSQGLWFRPCYFFQTSGLVYFGITVAVRKSLCIEPKVCFTVLS